LGACITYYLIPSKRNAKDSESEARSGMSQEMIERMRQRGGMPRFGMGAGMGSLSSRVSITILDGDGHTVSQLRGTENKGINRVYWSFREQISQEAVSQQPGRFGGRGLTVLPGEYKVKIKYDGQEAIQPFTVKTDPRIKVDMEILKANYQMNKKAQKLMETVNSAQRQIEDTRKAVKTVLEYARGNRSSKTREVLKAARDLDKKLEELAGVLNPVPPKQGIADRSSGLNSQVRQAVYGMSGGIEPINQAARVKLKKVEPKVEAFLEKFNNLYQTDVENFKKLLNESDFSLFKAFNPLKIEKE